MAYYTRLTLAEREELSRQLAQGHSLRAIARTVGRPASTLCRDVHRHAGNRATYRAVDAQHRAHRRAHQSRRPRKLDVQPALRAVVLQQLRLCWSPQQIARWLRQQYPTDTTMQLSHETLYTYLYVLPRGALRKELIACLRRHHHQRRPQGRVRCKPKPIQDFLSIEERPAEVADRCVPGHWEGDLLMGSRNASALGVLVERTTRWLLLVPLPAKDAPSVREAFAHALAPLPQHLCRTLTYDQGTEMAQHRLFTAATQMQVYFAHPHSPWERGTNENTNGLLRQFFPKGTNFRQYSVQQIQHVQDLMNGRPRQTLGWHTPDEVFCELLH